MIVGHQDGMRYLRALECSGDARRSVISTGCSIVGASIPSVINAQSRACSYQA